MQNDRYWEWKYLSESYIIKLLLTFITSIRLTIVVYRKKIFRAWKTRKWFKIYLKLNFQSVHPIPDVHFINLQQTENILHFIISLKIAIIIMTSPEIWRAQLWMLNSIFFRISCHFSMWKYTLYFLE